MNFAFILIIVAVVIAAFYFSNTNNLNKQKQALNERLKKSLLKIEGDREKRTKERQEKKKRQEKTDAKYSPEKLAELKAKRMAKEEKDEQVIFEKEESEIKRINELIGLSVKEWVEKSRKERLEEYKEIISSPEHQAWQKWGSKNEQIVCKYCQTKGKIRFRTITTKEAVLTTSNWIKGKEVKEFHCESCDMSWQDQ